MPTLLSDMEGLQNRGVMVRCNCRGLLSGKECTGNDGDALQWEGEGEGGGDGRAGEEVTTEQRR